MIVVFIEESTMRTLASVVILGLSCATAHALECPATDINANHKRLLGETENICETYGGKVLLITNVASHCGFTPQYEGLEKIYRDNKDQGLVVLGFPSGDFKDQEFQSDAQIAEFCKVNFGVTFPLFTRSSVKGDKANALFKKLIAETGQAPGWNFNKYLIGRDGQVIAHFGSKVEPDSPELQKAIADALKKS
jgi:glutathione peroxidase